jgi:NADH:ubiquinone oxidoreductase subunit 5 (subunit L)/multisubunit Na+/H+ antiporter MnhA subunit
VYGAPAVAVLGYAGALLHTLNHAVFKSLLFLGAGAVLRATGTRELDRLGGLGRVMPWTAMAFGVGAAAIVGLPPLNGFVSEWVVFQGLLSAGASTEPLRFAVMGAAGLALIGALALACFSKVIAVAFLGVPRARPAPAGGSGDPGPAMRVPILVLAAVCIGIGLSPAPVISSVQDIVLGSRAISSAGDLVPAAWSTAGWNLTWFGLGVMALTAAVFLLRQWRSHGRGVAIGQTWGCGSVGLTARMQYSASSYAAPLLAAFGPMAGMHRAQDATSFATHPVDAVMDLAVVPGWHRLERLSWRLRSVQGGRLRWYLASVILTVLALLVYLGNARSTP